MLILAFTVNGIYFSKYFKLLYTFENVLLFFFTNVNKKFFFQFETKIYLIASLLMKLKKKLFLLSLDLTFIFQLLNGTFDTTYSLVFVSFSVPSHPIKKSISVFY